MSGWWTGWRGARQERARAVYGEEGVHDFARRAILEQIRLGPADRLLEVGCGGGLLLRDALNSGASATGIDHSEDMVALARERAPGASVSLASADALPFPEAMFTAVAMSVVFFFFDDPLQVLRECHRVLTSDGRIAVYTTSAALRGTPAAPEPMASMGRFHTDDELIALAERAGFHAGQVHSRDGGQLLTARA